MKNTKFRQGEPVIIIEGNQATVVTDYVEEEEGFGSDYIGDSSKVLEIDVSDLDLVLEPGELEVSLIYEEEELVSLETVLGEGAISVESEPEEVEEEEEPEAEGNESVSNETVVELQNVTVNVLL